MADIAHTWTNQQIQELDRELQSVYSEAQRDIERKLEEFNRKFAIKEAKYLQQLKDGKITEEQFKSWRQGQVFQSEQWEAKRSQVARMLTNTNKVAADLINGRTQSIFGINASYISYDMEKSAGMDFGFGIYDADTVARLIRDNPQILPEWKINEKKDYIWNEKQINKAVTQGVIQGERLDQITKRIYDDLVMKNKNLSKTFARTAMTGAQNAGRIYSMRDAQKLGIDVEKEWMATLDGHTRDSHADVDGETQPVGKKFSNDCMYPGDPGGPPAEVYNCRCTLVSNVKKYPAYYSRRDNTTGKVLNKLGPDTVSNLTYKDWAIVKGVMAKAKTAEEKETISNILLAASQLGGGTVNYEVGSSNTSFDFMYKGFDSLFRKITTKSASKGLSKEEYAERITDALRFTNLSPAETLTEDYFKMINALESQGFKMVEVTNTFVDYTSYRGVNTLVKSPNGYIFELQFHTPQSMEIKEINHKLYEEERKLDKVKDANRIREIIATENKNAKSIITPKDVEKIQNVG